MNRLKTVFALIIGSMLVNANEVDDLIQNLGSGDKAKRREAARSLSLLGAKAKPAVPALIKGLDDDEEQVFFWSATALARIGPDAQEAAPELIKHLQRSQRRYKDQIHVRIVHALTKIGPTAVPQLTEALNSDDSFVRYGSAVVLGNLGSDSQDAASGLFVLLADEDDKVRTAAGSALGKIGPQAYTKIIKGLSSDKASVRGAAANAVIWLPSKSGPAIKLAEILAQESSPEVQTIGLKSLSQIGFAAAELLPLLKQALDSELKQLKQVALSGILSLQPNSKAAIPYLIDRLNSNDSSKRDQAISLLGRMGTDATDAVETLIARHNEAETEEQKKIRQALVDMGPASIKGILKSSINRPLEQLNKSIWQAECLSQIGIQAVPRLTEGIKNTPSDSAGLLALIALEKIGDKSLNTQSAILPLLIHEEAAFRGVALKALVASASKPQLLMPRLQSAMADPSPLVRQAAMDALASLGATAKGATAAMIKSLNDKDSAVQLSAIRAIGKLNSEDADLAERLVQFLNGANSQTRLAVVTSLGGFRQLPNSAVNNLVEVLKIEDAETQSAVFKALSKLGESARPALPALTKALTHQNASVRATALNALAKVETDKSKLLNALQSKLEDGESNVRHTAISELGNLGSDARPAGKSLFARFETTEDRQVTMDALRQIRVRDVDLYISILHNEEPLVRFFACQAIRRAGKKARSAEPALTKLKDDSYDFVRREARRALEAIR